LLDHLAAASARRIALMIGSSERNSYLETERAYLAFARKRRMQPVIVRVDESGGEEAAFRATQTLIEEHPRTDGLLALVDTFAAGALRALLERGIAVPERVRLATRYDGHRARESVPAITAIDLHLDDIAGRAVTLLLDRMQAGRSSGQIVLAPPPVLIPRRSTAGP
jgi:DNA-binding LacI/PurR family transcriptional regulator